jgi:CRISPR-associated endonuclease/helicase Cas3
MSTSELIETLRGERQVLCIVNSRRHAADLHRQLADAESLHLSASMCGRHRSAVLRVIRRKLWRRSACLVSTQVIEAGVDIDFPAVYRAEAGLDSIAQAAGRCNREGSLVGANGLSCPGRVVVFGYDSNLYPTDSLLARGAQAFREVAPDHVDDLLSPSAIEAYFRLHYWQQGGDDRYGWDKGRGAVSIMSCFSLDPKDGLHAQFRSAAEAYRLIDDAQTPLLVPYGRRGKGLIRELESSPDPPDASWLRQFDRAAQRYVVGVYERDLWKLRDNGVLLDRHGRYYLGNASAYHRSLGLTFEAIGLDVDRTVV